MTRREMIEKQLRETEKDLQHVQRNIRTAFDEWLIDGLEEIAIVLRGQLSQIDAAERVRRVLHEN